MEPPFSGKTAWVTGTAQGIGAAIAATLARQGCAVFGFDRQAQPESETLQPVLLDVSDARACAKVTQDMTEHFGAPDFFVGSAGILRIGDCDTLDPAEWDKMLSVNVSANFYMLHSLVPHFKKRRDGAIVLVSSNAARTPRMGMIGYAASKAALSALGRNLGLELAPHGVRCNMVSPGSTDTAMQRSLWDDETGEQRMIAGFPEQFKLGIPLGKIATPRDIAELTAFLLSDSAGHLTMQEIMIDGGATLGA